MKMQIELTITRRWWIDSPCQARAEKYCDDREYAEKRANPPVQGEELEISCGIREVVIP